MTDAEFYDRISELANEAMLGGLSRKEVVEDLRILAKALDEEGRDDR